MDVLNKTVEEEMSEQKAPITETKIERSNCGFQAQTAPDGKPTLVVQRYQETISLLKGATLGFDLLGGTSFDQAKKLAELLNDRVIDIFLTKPPSERKA